MTQYYGRTESREYCEAQQRSNEHILLLLIDSKICGQQCGIAAREKPEAIGSCHERDSET